MTTKARLTFLSICYFLVQSRIKLSIQFPMLSLILALFIIIIVIIIKNMHCDNLTMTTTGVDNNFLVWKILKNNLKRINACLLF